MYESKIANHSSVAEHFYKKLESDAPAIQAWQVLALGPQVVISILAFMQEYNLVKQALPPEVQEKIQSAPVLVFSIWAYCEVSGKTLRQLLDEEVLAPALLLYIVAVTQDDCFDELLVTNPTTKTKDCFWGSYTNEVGTTMDFQAEYDRAVGYIEANQTLSIETKAYIIGLLKSAWEECQEAEDTQVALRNKPVDLHTAHVLKEKSYGVLGRALTAVFNGSEASTPRGQEISEQMVAFCLLGGVVDGLADLEEDRGVTISTALAAEHHDLTQGLPKNTTSKKLFALYLRELHNTKVAVSCVLLSTLYPVMVGVHAFCKKVFRIRYNPVSSIFKV